MIPAGAPEKSLGHCERKNIEKEEEQRGQYGQTRTE